MSATISSGCREYQEVSRRQFLKNAALTSLAATLPAWLPQVAFAKDHVSNRDVLVSIYLRGGADGLSLCVPYGDAGYYAKGVRPNIAIPRPDSSDPNRAVNLDGFFGFAPAMSALLPAYHAGHLLVVHATGSTDPTRSHFDAQRFMEAGKPNDSSLHTGWLGRHLATATPMNATAALRGVSLSTTLPLTLEGGDRTLPMLHPNNFGMVTNPATRSENQAWLQRTYSRMAEPVCSSAENTINVLQMLQKLDFSKYKPGGGANYPQSDFGQALQAASMLIQAQIGVEAIHIDLDDWDTHMDESPLIGALSFKMMNLAEGLGAFHADILSSATPNVTVAAVSEFGRNVRENASRGTDHGHGNAMLVMGPQITGGRVLTKWPGLQPEQLYQGQDLQVTIDHRDILAEIVSKRLGNPNLDLVFPGYTPQFRGVTHA